MTDKLTSSSSSSSQLPFLPPPPPVFSLTNASTQTISNNPHHHHHHPPHHASSSTSSSLATATLSTPTATSSSLTTATSSLATAISSQGDIFSVMIKNIGFGILLPITEPEKLLMSNLSDKLATPCSRDNEYHVMMINEYWNGIGFSLSSPPIPHKIWRLAGFQSGDPFTDFRGGGELALIGMIYLVKNFQPFIQSLVKEVFNLTETKIWETDMRETDMRETDMRETDMRETERRETERRETSSIKKKDMETEISCNKGKETETSSSLSRLTSIYLMNEDIDTSSSLFYPYSAAFINIAFYLCKHLKIEKFRDSSKYNNQPHHDLGYLTGHENLGREKIINEEKQTIYNSAPPIITHPIYPKDNDHPKDDEHHPKDESSYYLKVTSPSSHMSSFTPPSSSSSSATAMVSPLSSQTTTFSSFFTKKYISRHNKFASMSSMSSHLPPSGSSGSSSPGSYSGWGHRATKSFASLALKYEHCFEQLFSLTCIKMHQEWKHLAKKSERGLIGFQDVFDKTMSKVCHILNSSPKTLDDLNFIIKE